MTEVTEPVPMLPKASARTDDRRLWVGNLDSRLRECSCLFFRWFQLLKMVEKFGSLAEFDFLYHRSGPQAGQPRGYAFVTFTSPTAAHSAMEVLDGRLVLGRRMAVKWAHAQDESLYERTKDKPAPPILSAGKGEAAPVSKQSKIAELEAKLKLLDENSLKVDLMPDVGDKAARPTSVTYHFIERRRPGGQGGGASSSSGSNFNKGRQNSSHPYSKSKPTGRRY